MPPRPQRVVLQLPPLSFLGSSLKRLLERQNILLIHFLVLAALYAALGIAATIEGTLYIPSGIGIVQNPPFLAHFLFGLSSLPLVFAFAWRIVRLAHAQPTVVHIFTDLIRRSRLKIALYSLAFLIGLFSLAYATVLAVSYRINIYDSLRYPGTFSLHLAVRTYLYLFCYPLAFAAAPIMTFHLFRALERSTEPYRPFHYDEMGGFRQYLLAVDRPIYALQSFAILIAIMNYFGWGGMVLVPTVLAVAAPALVTLLAAFLFVHFSVVIAAKKREEIQNLRLQQMELYSAARGLATLQGKDCLELLERIEATERLIVAVAKSTRYGFAKYFVNLGVLALSQIGKPALELLTQRLLGGFGP